MVSGDVLGISAQFVEKIFGKDVIAPVFAGASGDIDPWYRVLPEFNKSPDGYPNLFCWGPCLAKKSFMYSAT